METKWEIEAILDFLDRSRERKIPARDHLHKLIQAGYDFGKLSLKGLEISGTDFSDAKGLTIENWLSAKEANYTRLPPCFDFTHYNNLERLERAGTWRNTSIYETDFSLVAGLNPDKPTAWDANRGMPKRLNFPKDWFCGRTLFNWDMQNTEDITANELFQAKRMIMVKLPRQIGLEDAVNCGVKMIVCALLDPQHIEDKKALNKWVFDLNNVIVFSSFEHFLNAGSLDVLDILERTDATVEVKGHGVLVKEYIRRFLPRDLAKRRYSGEAETKAKVLSCGAI